MKLVPMDKIDYQAMLIMVGDNDGKHPASYLEHPDVGIVGFLVHDAMEYVVSRLDEIDGEDEWGARTADWPGEGDVSYISLLLHRAADGELRQLMSDNNARVGWIFMPEGVERIMATLDKQIPPCDYTHNVSGTQRLQPADYWAQDCNGAWTPLCAQCLPDFREGDDNRDKPFTIYPIRNVPQGELRLKNLADR